MPGERGSVQFKGVENVVQMFEYKQVEAWSIWQGPKAMIHKGVGVDELRAFLDLLKSGESNATYTLCVYEDFDDATKIKTNTPADGSFNFKLSEDYSGANTGSYNFLQSKIAALEQRLEKKNAEPESKLGVIGEIMDHPLTEMILPQIIGPIMNALFKGNSNNFTPAPVYSPAQQLGVMNGINEPNEAALQQALDTLKTADPKFTQHMQQLADMATNNKMQFSMMLQMLDNMQ